MLTRALLGLTVTVPSTLVEPFAIQLHNDGGGESMIQGGDSGGPMIAGVSSGSYVVGVNSAGQNPDLKSFIAPTFVLPNSAFLSFHGAGPSLIGDADGDGVIDDRDNCPSDANIDQIDLDNDGVGDVCDNCSPIEGIFDMAEVLSTYDGTPASAYSALYNPDQKNSNQEAEDEQLLAVHSGYLQAGAVQPIDETEYLETYKKFFGIVCNGADETQVKHMTRFRRGDVCDSIPAPAAEIVYSDAGSSVAQLPGGICGGNGYGFSTCTYELPVGFEVTPILGDGSGPIAGSAGVRFCECAQAHDTEADRRLNCGAGTVADCAIDGTRYSGADPSWGPLTAGETNATYNTEGISQKPFIPWDFLSDLATLSGSPVSLPISVDNDGSIQGVPPVDGVMWFHTPLFAGQPIANVPGDGIREPQQMASTYLQGDFRIKVSSTWHPFPEYKPAWPWEYCAVCGVFEFPWLWVLDDRLAIAVNEHLTVFDVTNEIERTAMNLLRDGLRVPASEPEFRLLSAGVTSREVILASALDVTPIGLISIDAGEIAGKALGAKSRRRGKETTRALAFSAVRNELFDLSLETRARSARLATWTHESDWASFSLSGEDIYTPLSMTFRLEDTSLYVIDREPRGRLRLLAIDLDSGRVRLISNDLAGEGSERSVASIANDRDGGLLVAVGNDDGTQLAHLRSDRGKWLAIDRATDKRTFVGDVRELAGGIYFVSERGREYVPAKVERRSFEEASQELEPLF